MATHNQVRVVGYLLQNPVVINRDIEGAEKILFKIRTVHRETDGYHEEKFQDLLIFYDGTELMHRMKKLIKFDLIDIKGVFNILTSDKRSKCPFCGNMNIKYRGASTFIYPIMFLKLNAVQEAFECNEELPDVILSNHYTEISNQALIMGTVVSDPEQIGTEKLPCCRYRLGVDRKYYIKTQDEITSDYPWVYSYAQQADSDFVHLKQGSLVLVDGFVRYRKVDNHMKCEHCGQHYTFPDVATELIPYSVEYLRDYITDEELMIGAAAKAHINERNAQAAVFGV